MIDRDLGLRNLTYGLIVRLGHVPLAREAADAAGVSPEEIVASWRRLHEAHALVLDGDEIRMANPFSAVPTPYRVETGGRSWYANCAWDAFGICTVLRADGRIESACPDCGDPIVVEVRDRRPDGPSLLFHCLVPAARWWDDIVDTRGGMNLFRSEEHVERWLAGRPPGATIPVAKLAELSSAWWDDRLPPDWRPHTREQNQAILDSFGLTGDFWKLP